MFNSPIPNAFTEGRGTLKLMAWVYVSGIGAIEAEVIEASQERQTVTVQRIGRLPFTIQFSAVQNVALKYADGTIEKNFGAPKAAKPETIAYIRYAEVSA